MCSDGISSFKLPTPQPVIVVAETLAYDDDDRKCVARPEISYDLIGLIKRDLGMEQSV